MPIIMSKNGKNAIRLEKSGFKQEVELQKYIYDNPECIPLDEIKEDVQFLVLDKEFPVNVGSIDVLGVDSEGDIYIIETKLYKNPDKRLVLAQVLDYGASLWRFYEDQDEFIHSLDQRLRNKTGIGLAEKLESVFGNSEEIITNVKQNLLNGTFKFLILMDVVPSALKNLILFMNQNSQFSIYSIELEYYKHKGYEILIPNVFGAESKKRVVPVSKGERKRWDEGSFFKDVKDQLAAEVNEALRKLYGFSKKNANEISWGRGAKSGTFNAKFHSISVKSVYTVWTNGHLTINFGWLDDNEYALQWREQLRKELKKINSIREHIPEMCDRKYPVIPPEAWTPVVDEFIITMRKLLEIQSQNGS